MRATDFPPETHHVSNSRDPGWQVCDRCAYRKHNPEGRRSQAEAQAAHRRSITGGRTRQGVPR